MKVVKASGIYKLFLTNTRFKAITMPWQTIYVLEESMNDVGLLQHESVHIEQIQRDGPWKFSVLYIWYNIRYGYWNNPYEIEAREKSGYI
jgi:hypothetical protein